MYKYFKGLNVVDKENFIINVKKKEKKRQPETTTVVGKTKKR